MSNDDFSQYVIDLYRKTEDLSAQVAALFKGVCVPPYNYTRHPEYTALNELELLLKKLPETDSIAREIRRHGRDILEEIANTSSKELRKLLFNNIGEYSEQEWSYENVLLT